MASIINQSVLPYNAKSSPYVKEADYCRWPAINPDQDVNFSGLEGHI